MSAEGYTISPNDPNMRYYEPNAVIIQENAPYDGSIYILHTGTLGVFTEGEQISEISEPGIFGEMATILNTDRTAMIKAMDECKVTVYTGGLQRIIEQVPSVAMKMMVSLAQRLQRQTALYRDELVRLENIEKMNQQLRTQVNELNEQIQELKAAQAELEAESKKSGLFGRRK